MGTLNAAIDAVSMTCDPRVDPRSDNIYAGLSHTRKMKKNKTKYFRRDGIRTGIVQPAVHAASHWATTPSGRMCLKYLFNVDVDV